jgi:hypothetical protein
MKASSWGRVLYHCDMTALLLASLIALQATTFDIATFTPPAGWQRVDQNGILLYQSQRTQNRRTSYCQIYLFPSRPGSADASGNFASEWTRLVATPFATNVQPRVESKQLPDGWTAVSGAVNVVQRGLPVSAILFTATGFGRVMSVVVNASGQDYLPDIQSFFAHLSFRAPAAEQAPVAAAPPAPGTSSESSGDIVYAVPEGWTQTTYPDGIVYASPIFSNGERCQITVFQLRAATGDLPADARNAYAEIFKTDPLQNNAYPFPTATLYRGTAAQGWDYFVIKRSIRGRVGEYGSLLGTTLLAAQLGNRLAVITGTGKDPLVSMCFGELVHDEWPGFFHSLRFKSWTPVAQEQRAAQRLAGTWTTATASVADQYTFAPNGRYASAAAAMTRTRLNDAEVLQTTSAFFGDGAYVIRGNTITFAADNDRANAKTRWFRVEQESKDGGVTWADRLCLLEEGVGEVCYTRSQ